MRILAVIVFATTHYLFTSVAHAAILLNEISPATDPEWLELYNDSTDTVDLTGYLLEDGNSSHTDDLPLTASILGHSYLVLTHAEGWLNNGGDTLKLYNNATPSALIIDQYTFGSIPADKSIFRSPDGSESWLVGTPTQNSSNPTPSPSPTPTPTPSPTQTLTPSPSPSPSHTPSPSPLPHPSLASSPTGTGAGEMVEIDLTGFGTITPSSPPTPIPSTPTLNSSRAKNVVLMGSGLVTISLAGYLGMRKYRNQHIING